MHIFYFAEKPRAVSQPIVAQRLEGDPMNEFSDNDTLHQWLFPHLFIFGRFGNGLKGKGTLSSSFYSHLLRQRSVAFAHEARFLFLGMNQCQRHSAIGAVHARAVNNDVKISKLGKLINHPLF